MQAISEDYKCQPIDRVDGSRNGKKCPKWNPCNPKHIVLEEQRYAWSGSNQDGQRKCILTGHLGNGPTASSKSIDNMGSKQACRNPIRGREIQHQPQEGYDEPVDVSQPGAGNHHKRANGNTKEGQNGDAGQDDKGIRGGNLIQKLPKDI